MKPGPAGKKSLILLLAIVLVVAAGGFLAANKFYHDNSIKTEQGPQKVSLVLQTGHTGEITALSFSPDRKMIASASADHTVKLWSLAGGYQLHTFQLEQGAELAAALSFSGDGRLLACGDSSGNITIWDTTGTYEQRGRCQHEKNAEVLSLVFSVDGSALASGADDNLIKIWEVKNTGKTPKVLSGHQDAVTALLFSRDGKKLFSGSQDKTIKVWNSESGQIEKTIEGLNGQASTLALSPSGKELAAGSQDDWAVIKVWDPISGAALHSLSGQGHYVRFRSDKTLCSLGRSQTIDVWDLASAQATHKKLPVAKYSAFAFNDNGDLLANASGSNIEIVTVSTSNKTEKLEAHATGITQSVFSRDGKFLACACDDRRARLIDLTNGRDLQAFAEKNPILSIAINPDGSRLATAGHGLTIWETATSKRTVSVPSEDLGHIEALAFSPDGRILASAGDSWGQKRERGEPGYAQITLWDIPSGRKLRTIGDHDDEILALSFSPDGKSIASASGDGTAKLWQIDSGNCIKTLPGHQGRVFGVAFSPDGKRIATAASIARVFDSVTGELIYELGDAKAGSPVLMKSLIFASNDSLVTCADTMSVWRLPAESKVVPLVLKPASILMTDSTAVANLSISPDLKTLSTSSREGEIELWNTTNWKQQCSIVPLDKTDWAVIANQGSFDASRAGSSLMNMRIGNEIVDLTQLKHRYFQPGLLAKILGFDKERLHDVIPLSSVKPCPQVVCQTPVQGATTVTIKLTNRGGGIGQVQVKLNDKLLSEDLVPRGASANAQEETVVVDLAKLPQNPGAENTITIRAFDKDNLLCSKDICVPFRSLAQKPAGPIEMYAIIGGVSSYSAKDLNLRFAGKDAIDIAKAITIAGKRLFGSDKVHVTLLSTADDNSFAHIAPTKKNFEEAFAAAKKAKPEDVFFVYLSGHGTTLTQPKDTYCYLTQDAFTTELQDKEVRTTTAITSDELSGWSRKVPALKQVFIFDTCGAGGVAEKLTERRNLSSDQTRAIDKLSDTTGVHVLMGCAADAVSYETSRFGQGLLTYSLLKGMRGEKLDEEKYVDVDSLFQFAADEVRDLARNIGGVQKPVIASPKGTSFPIGMLTKEDKAAIPIASSCPVVINPRLLDGSDGTDTLDLERQLKAKLQEANAAKTSAAFAFVGVDDYPQAYKPTGIYIVDGDNVSVNLTLTCGSKKTKLRQVKGSKSKIEDLVGSLVSAVKDGIRLQSS